VLIPPVLSETMVDGYLKNANADGTYVGAYLAVVAAMLGVTVAQRLIAAVRSAISVRVGTTTAQRLRASVFDKVQSLSLTDVNRRTAGELMQRVTSDTDVIGGFLTHTLGGVVEQTFTLTAIAVIFLVGGFKGGTNLFLFVFLPAIPAAILYRLFHKKIHRIYHMLWQVSAKASAETCTDLFALELPAELTPIHFIRLALLENGREIDSTVYWRSTSKYTGPKKMDGPTTAGFETMDSLPKTKLSAKAAPAKGGTLVTVRNDGKGIAFMVKLLARDAKGRNLKPTFYSDNWFSLMPGETKQVLVEPPTGAASWTAEAWNAPRVTGSLRN
jgi:hypothetical protein